MQQTSGLVAPGGGGGGGGGAPAPTLDAEGAAALHHPDQAQLEADKRSVYKHPLFPLLALLFERCEQATQSTEAPDSEGFNTDIQAFAHHHDRETRPFLVDDPELDGLMIKAIQVLRIHLLELEKVQELCKDFCNRYITCLKGKMQSENLLRSDYSGYESNNNSQLDNNNSNSSVNSSNSNSPPVGGAYGSPHSIQVVNCVGTNPLLIEQPQAPQQTQPQPTPTSAPSHGLDQQPPVPGLFGNMPSDLATSAGGAGGGLLVHGSTPLGQIGANPCPAPSESALLQDISDPASDDGQLSPAPTTPGSMDEDDDVLAGRKKHKRGVLPKHATSVMRSWLFQHLVHPYPTEDEKRHIAGQTNLTLLQVNNWFINARRRILQPMLDASHGGGGGGGSASMGSTPSGGPLSSDGSLRSGPSKQSGKHSSGKATKHRYWPDNIAHSAVHQPSSHVVGRRSLSSDDSDNASSQESEDDLFDDDKPSSESDSGNQH